MSGAVLRRAHLEGREVGGAAVTALETAVYVIPTDAPEADGTLAAAHQLQVSGHCAPNLHAHAAIAAPNLRHLEYFHDHVRIEGMLLAGALSPRGGALCPDLSAPGHGLCFKDPDAEPYRVA